MRSCTTLCVDSESDAKAKPYVEDLSATLDSRLVEFEKVYISVAVVASVGRASSVVVGRVGLTS